MKNKNFAIKHCPLCKQSLKLFYSGVERRYWCPTQKKNNFIDDEINHLNTHYYVKIDDSTITQMSYIDDYIIESYNNKSKVYLLDKNTYLSGGAKIEKKNDGQVIIHKTAAIGPTMPFPQESFTFLMEFPMITPDDPEKLLKKIKLLLPFS
jgi:hypothetical protein